MAPNAPDPSSVLQNPQGEQGAAGNADFVVDDVQSADGGTVEHDIQSPVAEKAVVEEVAPVDLQTVVGAMAPVGPLAVIPSEKVLNLVPVGVQGSFEVHLSASDNSKVIASFALSPALSTFFPASFLQSYNL
jgi:hypothetical protein